MADLKRLLREGCYGVKKTVTWQEGDFKGRIYSAAESCLHCIERNLVVKYFFEPVILRPTRSLLVDSLRVAVLAVDE